MFWYKFQYDFKLAPAKRGKKQKEPEEDEEEVEEEVEEPEEEAKVTKNSIAEKLKEADKKNKAPQVHTVDKICNLGSNCSVIQNLELNRLLIVIIIPHFFKQVYLDYDCMLNQTNIGHNNNKFYVIQIIDRGGYYSLWTRWGRVVRYYLNNMKYYLTKILLGRKRSK